MVADSASLTRSHLAETGHLFQVNFFETTEILSIILHILFPQKSSMIVIQYLKDANTSLSSLHPSCNGVLCA